ncbi:hypothetical protein ACQR1W_09220 [Bradyrhizobium sp. HKCCYLS1011]|uniref:hypothetical protein n=1 Tax=Bradyrhizobium sp. HKCCYLS1011 TaxID=3420733 RepID=UPI003EBBD587
MLRCYKSIKLRYSGRGYAILVSTNRRFSKININEVMKFNDIIRSKATWRRLAIASIAILLVEGTSAAICLYVDRIGVGRPLWDPDLQEAGRNWDDQGAIIDPEMGGYRASGAKENREFPSGSRSCGAAFGDSFVGGAETPDDKGWVEQLSHLLGCRIDNYAVGNYGTDQAYLRFLRINDRSPIALLGINPNNIEDNIGEYDAFLGAPLVPTAVKGRFLLDPPGHLRWVPQPALDRDGFIRLNRAPAAMLPNSYFLPDTRDGPVTPSFPYTVTLARVLMKPRLVATLAQHAPWGPLYDVRHPSGALQLMTAICQSFAEVSKSRGQRPLILFLPGTASFREKAFHGEFEYAPLADRLRAAGIETLDLGPPLTDELSGRSPCVLFTHQRHGLSWLAPLLPCGGHYSVMANTLIAKEVAAELQRRKFPAPPPSQNPAKSN